MALHWYPGHMHKARKEIAQRLDSVDLLIELLDARIPYSSENPDIRTLRGDKPCLKILNKADLADSTLTAHWQQHLQEEAHVKSLAISASEPACKSRIEDLCKKLIPGKAEGPKSIIALVVGIPNVGKSTLINTLSGRVIAKTGNEPAVTKKQQQINLGNGIILLDTPGILWPKVESPDSSLRLGTTAAIKDTAMDYESVGFHLAEYLLQAYPDLLRARFQLDSLPAEAVEFLELAAARRGALGAGGRPNLHRICEILVREFRSGALGKISLETPEMIAVEQQKVAQAQAEKAARKSARRGKHKASSHPTKNSPAPKE